MPADSSGQFVLRVRQCRHDRSDVQYFAVGEYMNSCKEMPIRFSERRCYSEPNIRLADALGAIGFDEAIPALSVVAIAEKINLSCRYDILTS
jgi:hypothetical protein